MTVSVFDLPDRLVAKADPALIAVDERHFAAIAEALEETTTTLAERLDRTRRSAGRSGQQALDRDLEVHRLTARLRTLRRFAWTCAWGASSTPMTLSRSTSAGSV